MYAQRPKPTWLLMAGTHNMCAEMTFAALSFFFFPVPSTIRLSRARSSPHAA